MSEQEHAYPHQAGTETEPGLLGCSPGMTLRDYFAAVALEPLMVSEDYVWTEYAKYAYEMADAMLAARKVKP